MVDRTRVLVTGCSSGFGAATVRALVAGDFAVVAGIRDSHTRNAAAAAALREAAVGPGTLDIIDLDVTSDASVDAAVAAAGEVDVLVNNAGRAAAGLIEAFSIAQAEQLFAVNFFGALRMVRAVLPQMKRRGRGLLIHVSSELGRIVLPGLGIYGATKAALDSLAECLHYELAATGVRSVSIEPGTYPTTGVLGNMMTPLETERAEGYGPVADLPQQLGAGIQAMIDHGMAPDPAGVADAIVGLVRAAQPPLRTLLPSPDAENLAALNRAALVAQVASFQRMNMTALLRES
jgi:NAD(P)-dependent dehydrogenase (short-subunit alcohol dehydrogenase family)